MSTSSCAFATRSGTAAARAAERDAPPAGHGGPSPGGDLDFRARAWDKARRGRTGRARAGARVIGPAEIDEMMSEYAESLAAPEAERPAGTPVWADRTGEAATEAAPFEPSPLLPPPLWFLATC